MGDHDWQVFGKPVPVPHGQIDRWLAVDSQDRDGETLFTVTLLAKKGTPFEDEACTLTIVSSGRTVGTVRPHAARAKNAVTFEFQLARDVVAESMLSISSAIATAAERKRMTSAAGWITYEFALRDCRASRHRGQYDLAGGPADVRPFALVELPVAAIRNPIERLNGENNLGEVLEQ